MGKTTDIREEYTYIEINGEDYRIGNINPMVGVYIGAKMLDVLAPLIKTFLANNKGIDSESFKAEDVNLDDLDIQGALSKLEKKDFIDIQTECLKTCEKHSKAGWFPVINSNGSFAFQLTIKEVVKLEIECIKFNLSDFFGGESQS